MILTILGLLWAITNGSIFFYYLPRESGSIELTLIGVSWVISMLFVVATLVPKEKDNGDGGEKMKIAPSKY